MDLASDKIPNKMLLGTELLECAVAEFRQMLERDYYFHANIAYRRVAFTIQATFHFGYPHPPGHVLKSRTKKEGALEGEVPLDPLCKCGHERNQLHKMGQGENQSCFGSIIAGAGMVPCPCTAFDPADEDDHILSLERDVNFDNPNLARVQHNLPITIQERIPPKSIPLQGGIPGETPASVTSPFPELVTHHLKYDKTQYPKGEPPVDRDISEAKAKELGLKRRNRG